MNATHEDNFLFSFEKNSSLANDTSNVNGEQDIFDIEKKKRISQVVFLLISSIGIFGNFVSILALTKSKKLRNPTTTFVTTLCVADLLFCLCTFINYINIEWNQNYYFCILITWAKFFVGGESVYLIVGITINRYICVVHPNYYHLIYQTKYLVLQITLAWLYSFLISLLPFFEIWGKYGYDPNSGLCIILRQKGTSAKVFFFISYFAFPVIVLIICYPRILWVSLEASERVRKSSLFVTASGLNATATCNGIQSDYNSESLMNDKDMKLLKVMLVIVVAFTICYFPMVLIKFFDNKAKISALTAISYLAINVSNVINPIIYFSMSNEYRKAYLELFKCKDIRLQFSVSTNSEMISV
ncbi:G-protein coupled receptor moody-like [Parasteatoda tepidariorum]|uniref:G-protein coupled receptor moody-like n=1 Tax=Parasteatoda tepidariorum TaxID=114398 RepID=UPI001C71D263|nr:G-protein coupled receptor moody-like [Parasteatoda tepidariorum]